MSDLIIKIGDDALDLSTGETVAITKQAAKVGDFSTVLADGTNEITVPLTANNRLIMDNAHLMPSDSDKPYSRLDAMLIQEGYQTLQDGYAIVKTSINNFSLQVVGGNASFFNLIKDLNLRSLPLREYEHFWTNQKVYDKRNETEGLIYAIFEQSTDVPTMTTYGLHQYAVETDLLLPSFYVKTLVEKIFEAQGYTFITDLTGEDIYDKAVVFRGAIPNRGEDMSYHECTVRNEANQYISLSLPDSDLVLFQDASIDANTSTFASSAELLTSIQGTAAGVFGVTDSCSLTFTSTLTISNAGPVKDFRIKLLHTSANGIINTFTNTQSIPTGTSTKTFTVTFDCVQYEGENYFVPFIDYVVPSLDAIDILADSTYTVSDVVFISNTGITSIFPFNYLTGFTMIPDMKQGDFLKELARIYQWIFDTDELTRTVTAKRLDQVKDNIPNAIDLSDKIDSRNIKINFSIDGFAQTNTLRYLEDDLTKYDAVGYINVDDTTLNAESNYATMSKFAATSTVSRFDTVKAPRVGLFSETLPTNGVNDRIFIVKRVTFPYNINFNRVTDIPTDDVTFAYFTEAGNDDSLDFPTLIRRFYQTIIDMNFRAKSVECDVNLKIKDVMNYDPFTPVYIQSMGNYFYWEKLSNYVKDKLTKCKFVKI